MLSPASHGMLELTEVEKASHVLTVSTHDLLKISPKTDQPFIEQMPEAHRFNDTHEDVSSDW